MKKITKRLLVTFTILFALFGAGVSVAWAAGYINWGGTQNYELALVHMDNTQAGINDLKRVRDNLIVERDELQSKLNVTGQENEQLNNQIKDLENTIDSLEQDIVALEKRIEGGRTAKDQLGQAEIDMAHIEERARELMNELDQ